MGETGFPQKKAISYKLWNCFKCSIFLEENNFSYSTVVQQCLTDLLGSGNYKLHYLLFEQNYDLKCFQKKSYNLNVNMFVLTRNKNETPAWRS